MLRKATFVSFVIILLLSAFSFAEDNVAIMLKVRNDVRVTPTNKTSAVQGKRGYVLQDGNKIETGAKSFCAIKFLDDKSLLRIRENSTCVVEGEKEQSKIDKNIIVEIGSFFTSLFKPRGSFKVTTPTSVASVKGTKFWVIQQSPTKYIVEEGVVEVENDAGKALVRAGQTAVVESRTSEIQVYLTRPDEIPTELEEEESGAGHLDIGFQNDQGEEKTMRIKFKE